LLPKELLSNISLGCAVSLEKELLPAWAEQGFLCGFETDALFIDIGTPESYNLAESLLPE